MSLEQDTSNTISNMSSGTLLIPDRSPEFVQSFKLAAVYSETVHTFAFSNLETVNSVEVFCDKMSLVSVAHILKDAISNSISGSQVQKPADNYCENSVAADDDEYDGCGQFISDQKEFTSHAMVGAAHKNGILSSISETAYQQFSTNQKKGVDFLSSLFPAIESVDFEAIKKDSAPVLMKALSEASPSLFELIAELFDSLLLLASGLNIPDAGKITSMIDDSDVESREIAFMAYMMVAAHYAVANELTPVTNQPNIQVVLAALMNGIRKDTPPTNELIRQRADITNQLGELVLTEMVPNVSELPLDAILDIREKRRSEIMAFQDGLAQVAADIDCTLGQEALEFALDTRLKQVFKPALRDLNRAVDETRVEGYRKLLEPDKEMALTFVPMTISLSMGAPVAVTAANGAFPLLAKLYEFTVGKIVDRNKLIKASPWSILFRLQQKKIKK